jgi:hypothetical protein
MKSERALLVFVSIAGPKKELFEKTWKLPDIERMN